MHVDVVSRSCSDLSSMGSPLFVRKDTGSPFPGGVKRDHYSTMSLDSILASALEFNQRLASNALGVTRRTRPCLDVDVRENALHLSDAPNGNVHGSLDNDRKPLFGANASSAHGGRERRDERGTHEHVRKERNLQQHRETGTGQIIAVGKQKAAITPNQSACYGCGTREHSVVLDGMNTCNLCGAVQTCQLVGPSISNDQPGRMFEEDSLYKGAASQLLGSIVGKGPKLVKSLSIAQSISLRAKDSTGVRSCADKELVKTTRWQTSLVEHIKKNMQNDKHCMSKRVEHAAVENAAVMFSALEAHKKCCGVVKPRKGTSRCKLNVEKISAKLVALILIDVASNRMQQETSDLKEQSALKAVNTFVNAKTCGSVSSETTPVQVARTVVESLTDNYSYKVPCMPTLDIKGSSSALHNTKACKAQTTSSNSISETIVSEARLRDTIADLRGQVRMAVANVNLVSIWTKEKMSQFVRSELFFEWLKNANKADVHVHKLKAQDVVSALMHIFGDMDLGDATTPCADLLTMQKLVNLFQKHKKHNQNSQHHS